MKYRRLENLMSKAAVATLDYLEAQEARELSKRIRDSKNWDLESFRIATGWFREEMDKMDEAFERFIEVYRYFLLEYDGERDNYVRRLKEMLQYMGLDS